MFIGIASGLAGGLSTLAKSLFKIKKRQSRRRAGLARTLRFEPLEYRQLLAVLTVNLNQDNTTADSLLTLREAAAVVNFGTTSGVIPDLGRTLTAGEKAQINTTVSFGSNDKIQFISSGEILLVRAMGQIEIRKSVVIDASTLSSGVIINGNDPTPGQKTGTGIRIFNITDSLGGSSPPLVELVNLTLIGADTTFEGGAIRSAGRLIVRDCAIHDNEADTGGAIYVQVAGGSPTTQREILRIEDSYIHDNTAFTGGGIAIVSGDMDHVASDVFSIAGTTIENNYALSASSDVGGGGVYAKLFGARPTFTAGTLTLNTSTFGGGAYADLNNGAAVSLVGTTLSENPGNIGAGLNAVLNGASSLHLENATFYHNVASSVGGGARVLMNGASTVDVIGSQFQLNEADGGAGIYAEVNEASQLNVLANSLFDQNMSSGGGGGLEINSVAGMIAIDHSTFTANMAQGIGSGGAIKADCSDNSTLEITSTTISGNTTSVNGGGIYGLIHDGSAFSLTDSTISGNSATDGGGVNLQADAFGSNAPMPRAIVLSRSTFSNNTASNRGGGIFTLNHPFTATLVEQSTITGNQVPQSVFAPNGNGGGIYAYVRGDLSNTTNKPRFTITGTTVDNNKTNLEGGGIFVCAKFNGEFVAVNSTLSSNSTLDSANGKGGGIFIAQFGPTNDSVDAFLRSMTITKNVSTSGGGMEMVNYTGVRVQLANSIISQNYANVAHSVNGNLKGRLDIANAQYNLVGTGSTILNLNGSSAVLDGTNLSNNDSPGLGDLLNNGGPTRTHALDGNSPAIDRGGNSYLTVPLTADPILYDQRGAGFARKIDVVGILDPDPIVDIGAYELLVGDYDRDGDVDCGDLALWKAQYHDDVPRAPYEGADGNGDRYVDTNDYNIWANAWQPNRHNPIGDFDDNGTVDYNDYKIWSDTYSTSGGDLRADANCDGKVDTADYVIWRDMFGSTRTLTRFGMLDALVGPDSPPELVGVMLASSSLAFDFAGVAGSGEQLRSVPLSGVTKLSLTFSQGVTVSQNTLQVINLDGTVPSIVGFVYEPSPQTATWTFASELPDGRYLVRLADSVHNSSNAALDGEFTNPWSLTQTGTSVFASGNGTAGGEFRFRFTVMAGDLDHDNIVGTTNYQNWKSYEPGRAYVSTTTDDYDSDVSFGDFSLREAINYANTATEATTIELPAGHYYLTRSGTEMANSTAYNDLDIFGNMKIVGAGPGATIIDAGNLTTDDRVFDVANLGLLGIAHATLALGAAPTTSGQRDGGAVRVQNGGQFDLDYSAVVGNATTRSGYGGAIFFGATAHGSIANSVITVNYADNMTGGVYLQMASAGTGGAVTVTRSIIVNNTASSSASVDVFASTNRTFTSGGYNRLGNAATGFTNGVNGDYIKPTGTTVAYVVTSAVDSYDGTTDLVDLSLRDAISLANAMAGTQEIWLPAWNFVLTRQRTTAANLPEPNVSEGDIEITDSLILHGIGGIHGPVTSVAWAPGISDKVFELVGDYNGDGLVSPPGDYVLWRDELGQSASNLPADGNDDGTVNGLDEVYYQVYAGNTLEKFDIAV